MNTYNDNLQATVDATLAELAADGAKLHSAQAIDAQKLYFAQGAEIAAREQWQATKATATKRKYVNDLCLSDDIDMGNVLLSAQGADADVATSQTNMATAAANIQIASNAIAELAGNIGDVLGQTNGSLYGTHVYDQLKIANAYLNEVVNEAKQLSRVAMDASSKTSEIVSAALLAQATEAKTTLDKLLAATQAEVDKYSKQSLADNSASGAASQVERQAEGVLADSETQIKANSGAYKSASKALNLGLHVKVKSAKEIEVWFKHLPKPVPGFETPEAQQHIKIPDADPSYYLTLVPEDQQPLFSLDVATRLFESRQPDDDSFHQFEQAPDDNGATVKLSSDAFGTKVHAGANYVAYLYIVLSKNYQRFIGSFAELLSSPSRPFVPATHLPKAEQPVGTVPQELPLHVHGHEPLTTIPFTIEPTEPFPKEVEYRCILVEEPTLGQRHFKKNPHYEASIYLSPEIAQQVPRANYELAYPVGAAAAATEEEWGQPPSEGEAVEAQAGASNGVQHFVVVIYSTTTDNFGNKLKPHGRYKPHILTLIDSDHVHSSSYISVLSHALDVKTIPAGV